MKLPLPWLVGLGVGAFVFLDLMLVVIATQGFQGTVDRNYYKKGMDYNRYLEERQEQARLGWQVKIGWQEEPRQGQPVRLRVEARDDKGLEIQDAEVQAKLMRPGNPAADRVVAFDAVGNGLYVADFPLELPGAWNLTFNIASGAAQYERHASLWVKPASNHP